MNLKIWLALRTYKRIMYYEKKISLFKSYISKTQSWRKDEKKLLLKQLQSMSADEALVFEMKSNQIRIQQ
jgi:hypothetical protein